MLGPCSVMHNFVFSGFAILRLGKTELVALLLLSS